MSHEPGIAKRRQQYEGVDYPYCPEYKGRAGKKLREQAIQRTIIESQYPHEVWGINGRTNEFATAMNRNESLKKSVLMEEALVRLSLLRAVNFR